MRFRLRYLLLLLAWIAPLAAHATIFGAVKGIVHDPQHRPIAGARVTVQSADSGWKQTTRSGAEGEFLISTVPLGSYTVTAEAPGFAAASMAVLVTSGNAPVLHIPLPLEAVQQSMEVSAEPEMVDPTSSSAQTIISRREIAATPGAELANSLAMITDYVPGSYIVHDQLHIRGGHQVTWLIDGVPVPNTNIASNVGPQFDPKDIDTIEVQRGGLTADTGDRTYGAFNVVTRSGFERNHGGEVLIGFGNHYSTDDQISFGSHTERFAYYASLSGNRSDLGLETPTPAILHDAVGGLSAFTSLIFNATPSDQLRLVTSVRGDHYQVPNTPQQQTAGVRDTDDERDAFLNFSWIHSTPGGITLTVAPFYHHNSADYTGRNGFPVTPDDNRSSHYVGGVISAGVVKGRHNARFGFQVFGDHEDQALRLRTTDGSNLDVRSAVSLWGDVEALYAEDQYRPTGWLTLNGGARLNRFSGPLTETTADPRLGAAIEIPRLHWVLRAFYGRYYQPPPLVTVGGPLLELAAAQGFGFLPLHGERDEQREFGLAIPFRRWAFEVTNFRTGARNFFDHDALGNSNIFFPLTIAHARIRGWEVAARSPHIAGRLDLHLAYSHQFVEGSGGVTGGLTDFTPPPQGTYFLDHDQRDTLSTGLRLELPRRAWTSSEIAYGSGFLDGDGPGHLPPHATWDLSLGKSFGERWSASVTALNLANSRYRLDNSNTFGGTHYVNPRIVFAQVRFRFHY